MNGLSSHQFILILVSILCICLVVRLNKRRLLKDDEWRWTMDVDQYQGHRSQSGNQKICRQTDGWMQDKKLLGTLGVV